MIKINLSPLRRPKTSNKGARLLLIAGLLWGTAAVAVVLLIHLPISSDIDRLDSEVQRLTRENTDKRNGLKGYEELKRDISDAEARAAVVERLNKARAVPAHMLHELSRILTPNALPTVPPEVQKQLEEGRVREFARAWDPSHVWIQSFEEDKDGKFRLVGAAQSDSDMTQLALRLDASVYFSEVVPVGGSESTDKDSGNTLYNFTITGKVAY